MSFDILRTISGQTTYGIKFNASSLKYSMKLLAGIPQSIIVPPSSVGLVYFVLFSYQVGTDVWVAKNTTAEFPTGAPTSTHSEHNPVLREVVSGDYLNFVTTNESADVWVSFYPK